MSRHSRWIKFFVIPLAISIAAIVGIVAWAYSGDPRSEASAETPTILSTCFSPGCF